MKGWAAALAAQVRGLGLAQSVQVRGWTGAFCSKCRDQAGRKSTHIMLASDPSLISHIPQCQHASRSMARQEIKGLPRFVWSRESMRPAHACPRSMERRPSSQLVLDLTPWIGLSNGHAQVTGPRRRRRAVTAPCTQLRHVRRHCPGQTLSVHSLPMYWIMACWFLL